MTDTPSDSYEEPTGPPPEPSQGSEIEAASNAEEMPATPGLSIEKGEPAESGAAEQPVSAPLPEIVATPEVPPVPVPPAAPPQYPMPPAPPSAPSHDERTWATLAHLSVLLNLLTLILGPVVALVIYLSYRDKSRFVAFHALQSFYNQLFWWIGAGILATGLWIISILLAVICVGFCLMPFALILSCGPLIALVYGVVGAIKVNQGEDFKYWMVGDWAA